MWIGAGALLGSLCLWSDFRSFKITALHNSSSGHVNVGSGFTEQLIQLEIKRTAAQKKSSTCVACTRSQLQSTASSVKGSQLGK